MANIIEIVVQGKTDLGKAKSDVDGFKAHLGRIFDVASGVGLERMVEKGISGVKEGLTWYAKYAEEVRKVSILTGQSVEDSSRLINAADDVGVAYEDLAKGLNIFSKNMNTVSQAQDGFSANLTTNAKVLESIGISVKDSAGNMRPMQDILLDLSDTFSHMPDGIQKTGLAMQLFGRGGASMVEFLNQGRDALQASYKDAEKWGQILSKEDVDAAHQFTLAQRDLNDAFDSLKIKIGKEALPVLTQLSRAFTSGLEDGDKFKKLIAGLGFAALASLANLGTAVTNGLMSIFEKAINWMIEQINSLGDKIKVPDFIPGVGGSRVIPKMDSVELGRSDYVDPLQGLKKMFPEMTRNVEDLNSGLSKTNPQMKDFAAETKRLGEIAQNAKDLLKELEDGEISLATARKNGLVTEGPNGEVDASKAGALEAYQAVIDMRDSETQAAYDLSSALSEVAVAFGLDKEAAIELTQKMQEQTRAKIEAAQAELFGKGTREQAQMELQIMILKRALEQGAIKGRSPDERPSADLSDMNRHIQDLNRELSRLRANDMLRKNQYTQSSPDRAGFKPDPNIERLTRLIEHQQAVAGSMQSTFPGDPQMQHIQYQIEALQRKLDLSRLNSDISQQEIKVHDYSIPTDSEQAARARELTGMMATTTGDMRRLSDITGKGLNPAMDAARASFQQSDGAMRVLTDDVLRGKMIPAGYDVAAAYQGIIEASHADVDAVNAHAAAVQAAADKINNIQINPPSAAPAPQNSIRPPNVGDGGIVPHKGGKPFKIRSMGM